MATVDELVKAQETAAGQKTTQTDAINQIYDAQKENQLKQLESSYNQSLSDANAAAAKIPGQYQTKANDLAVQYERNRQNFNAQAAGSGINTGTAAQASLARNSEYQRDFGNIRTAQAEAQTESDRGIANLTSSYQNSISQAVADNDYKRAAALLDEYNNQYNKDLSKAQTLAQYGDFSAYASIYGQDAADNMAKIWKTSNPGLAYNTGRITADEYHNITGSYPAGYSVPGYGGGWNPGVVPPPEPDAGENANAGSTAQMQGVQRTVEERLKQTGSAAAAEDVLNRAIASGVISYAQSDMIAANVNKNFGFGG